jgi:hypothetical protein
MDMCESKALELAAAARLVRWRSPPGGVRLLRQGKRFTTPNRTSIRLAAIRAQRLLFGAGPP